MSELVMYHPNLDIIILFNPELSEWELDNDTLIWDKLEVAIDRGWVVIGGLD